MIFWNDLEKLFQIHEPIQLYDNPPTITKLSCTRIVRDDKCRNLLIHSFLCYCGNVIYYSLIYIMFYLITHHIVFF